MPSVFARSLRKNMTDAERRLWAHLRYKQLDQFRFRRQQPLGPYIVDFYCPEAALIVEVDGGQHTPQVDAKRTRYLEKGHRILRFWNNDVLKNTEGVLMTIREALRACSQK